METTDLATFLLTEAQSGELVPSTFAVPLPPVDDDRDEAEEDCGKLMMPLAMPA
jgi:hypothetical protein